MDIDLDELDGQADKLYNFLHKWAFKVERERFDKAMEKMAENIRYHNKGEQRKQGWFFMMLLQKMNRYVDWKFAQEMEIDFERNGKRIRS